MTEFPNGWSLVKLGEVAKWSSGGTPQSGNPSYYNGDIPWAVIGDLNEATVLETEKCITQKGLDASSAKLVPVGTVLLAMYGASIGRAGIAGKPMATNQAIATAIVNPELLDSRFLLLYLQSQKPKFVSAGKGGAQPNISQTIIKDWDFPLPPLSEQKRIIEKLDEYLSRLDKAQAELSLAHSKLDVFRRSAIEALTIGDETWTTSALGDVTNVNWGDTSLTKSSYRNAGFTAFSASGPDGFIDKYDFDKDGVVLSAIGAACGKVFFATGKWSGIKNTICITPKDSAVSAKYLYYFLNDTNGWQKRGAAQPFIRQADARARTVRYPNLNKQQELIETLEAQITLFEILSKDLQNQMQQVVLLRRSVLKIAFEGNLRGQ